MKKIKLDNFEQDLESSFEKDNWVEVQDLKERHQAIGAAKMVKSERTNIRLSSEDLIGIKEKANEYGLGYQTLIASIVHRYVIGKLVDVRS